MQLWLEITIFPIATKIGLRNDKLLKLEAEGLFDCLLWDKDCHKPEEVPQCVHQ